MSALSEYKSWSIPKANGGFRKITAPNDELKIEQTRIKELLELIPLHSSAHGFVFGRNILTNAKAHLSKPYVLNIDIENFFPSISKPLLLNLLNEHHSLSDNLLSEIEEKCFLHGGLPQGSPSSPVLANLFMSELDLIFAHYAADFNLSYTRYADDLTFSGSSYLKEQLSEFLDFIDRNLSCYKLKRSKKKTKLMPYYQRQLVTGLVVNTDVISIPRFKRDELFKKFKGRPFKDLNESDIGLLEFVRSVNAAAYNKIMRGVVNGKD